MAPTTYADVLARNIRAARSRADLSQQTVAARMRVLGFDAWLYQTVGNVEKGRRRVTAEEIFGLALVLDTTIPALMSASDQDNGIQLPGGQMIGAVSIERLAGRGVNDRSITWHDGDTPVVTRRRYLPDIDPFDKEVLAQPDFTEVPDTWHPAAETMAAEQSKPPVIAAIITSERGVLISRRNDADPPWGFITGEQDAVKDENPADTAKREAKEEVALRIVTGPVIGELERHSRTGRHMIYIAAKPAPRASLDVTAEDTAELAEVRWVSLAEADEKLPGMFRPVHDYLERELGEAQR